MAFDGSVNIGTKISIGDLKAGISRIQQAFATMAAGISAKFSGVSGSFKGALGKIKSSLLDFATEAAIGLIKISPAIFSMIFAVSTGFLAVRQIVTDLSRIAMMAWRELKNSISQTSAYYSVVEQLQTGFDNLKGALLGAFGTLLTAALPAIMTVVNWLTRMINLVAQVIAALSGQSTYMKYAASSSEKAAKSTEKQAKAAKGALAAFDEISVLQKQEEPSTAAADTAGGGPMQFEAAPIEAEAQSVADKIKKIWGDLVEWATTTWGNITKPVTDAWNTIQMIWAIVSTWFNEKVWKPVSEWAGQAWENIKAWAIEAWENIKRTWGDVGAWFKQAWEDVKKWFSEAWENIKKIWEGTKDWFDEHVINPLKEIFDPLFRFIGILAHDAWVTIQYVWNKVGDWFYANVTEPVKQWFAQAWEDIKGFFSRAWDKIKEIWGSVSSWFYTNVTEPVKRWFSQAWEDIKTIWGKVSGWFSEHITEPMKSAFETAFTWITEHMERVLGGIADFFKGIINAIIDRLNGLLSGIAEGINGIINTANRVGEVLPGWITIPTVVAPQIPRLATGAVIPPNAAFAAVLGDQTTGRNLEAPEGLIRQIIREELRTQEVKVTVSFEGTLAQLVRELRPAIESESRRIGSNLIVGGT